jgi:c-di-AMP phosphodiesterase-like protein
MKFKISLNFTLIPIGILLFFWSCSTNASNSTDEIDQLLNLEREAIENEFKNDTSFLSSIMDTTFIELSKDKIKNKHEVLRTIFQDNLDKIENEISLDSFRMEEPVVHLYQSTAVVTFILHTFRKKQDSLFQRSTRFYDVWIKRESQWKAVTWQASPL